MHVDSFPRRRTLISTLHTQSRVRCRCTCAACSAASTTATATVAPRIVPATTTAAAAAATDTDSTHWCSSSAQTMKISPSVSTLILLAPALGTAIRKKKNQRET